MKIALALLVVVIGSCLVAAEENLEKKLKLALKTLLQRDEELAMASRDTRSACMTATNSCNNQGNCVEDSRGEWFCRCNEPYRVGGSESSCYLPGIQKKELEMEVRDTVAACERDTSNCNGHGKCQKSSFGRSFICICDPGFVNNQQGGCSELTAREVEYLDNVAREVELALLARDSLARCNLDTNNCDGNGECQKSTFGRISGQYTCKCNEGYRNNLYGGCSLRTKEEREYLSMIARDIELDVESRDSFAICNRDTNNCDGFGECKKSTFGRTTGQYICKCNEGYNNNLYGGCSPESSDEGNGKRELKLDVLRRLATLLDDM